jgi:hypothetical protein
LYNIRREALEKWKQMLGSGATYNNLIKAFEQAGHRDYAEIVKDLVMKIMQTDTNRHQTPPPPSQQLPILPPKSVLQEDYQLGT